MRNLSIMGVFPIAKYWNLGIKSFILMLHLFDWNILDCEFTSSDWITQQNPLWRILQTSDIWNKLINYIYLKEDDILKLRSKISSFSTTSILFLKIFTFRALIFSPEMNESIWFILLWWFKGFLVIQYKCEKWPSFCLVLLRY